VTVFRASFVRLESERNYGKGVYQALDSEKFQFIVNA
jgi:hypothetical protein